MLAIIVRMGRNTSRAEDRGAGRRAERGSIGSQHSEASVRGMTLGEWQGRFSQSLSERITRQGKFNELVDHANTAGGRVTLLGYQEAKGP